MAGGDVSNGVKKVENPDHKNEGGSETVADKALNKMRDELSAHAKDDKQLLDERSKYWEELSKALQSNGLINDFTITHEGIQTSRK